MTAQRMYRFRVLAAMAFILSAFCTFALPSRALAYVSDSDIVHGETAADRGIPAAELPDILGTYACMIDNHGTIYYERGAHVPQKIASMTKVMTAIVALEHSDPDEIVTVSARAAGTEGSSAYLHAGDRLTMYSLLCCLLIPSGNDAAMAIADHIGAKALSEGWDLGLAEGEEVPTDPYYAFIRLMNLKGAELGLEDSLFVNPHGLDDGMWTGNHHSTPYDVCLMAKYAMTNETFRSIVRQNGAIVPIERDGSTFQRHLASSGWYLKYDNATGVKTGWTDLAGLCFVGSAKEGDLELYAVVTHSEANQRFYDVRAMHVWGFEHVETYRVANSPESVQIELDGEKVDVPVFAEVAHPAWIDRTIKTYLEDPEEEVLVFDFDGDVTQEVTLADLQGPIKAGDVVGTVTFFQHGNVLSTQNIIAAEDSGIPDVFESIIIQFERMKHLFKGRDTVAQTVVVNTLPPVAA